MKNEKNKFEGYLMLAQDRLGVASKIIRKLV